MNQKRWLKHYPVEIPTHIDYEDRPLQDYLHQDAMRYPHKAAIHFLGKTISYSQLFESASKIANRLIKLGLHKGDRVSIMLPNCPQGVISYYGVLLAGGIVVQTNPLYTARELKYQLLDSGSKIIIGLDFAYPKMSKMTSETDLKHVIVTRIQDFLPFPKHLLYPLVQKKQKQGLLVDMNHEDETTHLFKNIIKNESANIPEVDIEPTKDLALIQYTAGTTGAAKGVMLTHRNLVANTTQTRVWMYTSKNGEEKILGLLPFFHVYGMTTVMNLSVMYAWQMVLLPKFDIKETLKTIEKQKPTLFPGAPTMYIGLLNDANIGKYDLSSIQSCISGSAPLPMDVQEKFEDKTKAALVEGYGLSESSPVTHANLILGRRVKGSIGLPFPDTNAAILSSETGKMAGVNEIGELMVSGPQVMQGYWRRPEETEKTFWGDWLLTGDIGYMDENGYFYIIDRKKDVIIAGGFNIYPREVEEVLYEHDAVQEAAVVGIPDSYRGETVKVFIVKKEGQNVDEEELNTFCRKYLAAYKVPKQFEIRRALPKSAIGKILKKHLIREEKKRIRGEINN